MVIFKASGAIDMNDDKLDKIIKLLEVIHVEIYGQRSMTSPDLRWTQEAILPWNENGFPG